MLLGVISDTHGQLDIIEQAVRDMKQRGVEQVIHCGDVGGPAAVALFRPLSAHFVAGNCDSAMRLQMAVEGAGQRYHGRAGELNLEGRKISFLHGDSLLAIQGLLAQGDCDLIAHGHTHMAGYYRHGDTIVLNPGALVRCDQPSIAVVRLPDLMVTPVTL